MYTRLVYIIDAAPDYILVAVIMRRA